MSEQSPWPPRVLPAGARVADYRLDEQIGQGGMAVVYRAYDLPLERQVALKILDPALAQDEEFQQRFIRESRAAAAVDHPNIIPVFGAGQADGVLFIAMRFVAGADVRTLLDRLGPLPAPRVAGIVAQVAAALDSAHHRGLVHRDVKPANILLDAGQAGGHADHVYLSDFGLSKQALASLGLTGAGQLVGTLDYLAPEQITGGPVDGRADLYALACTAFEMLAGSPPYRRDHRLAVLGAQLSQPPPLLTGIRPGLPPEVDQVMARALAKSPDDRYHRCQDFAAALGSALDQAGLPAAPDAGYLRATEPRPGWVSPPLGPEPPAGRAPGHRAAGHRRTQPPGPGGGRAWYPSCWPWWPSAWPGPCWPSPTTAGRPRWRWPHQAASPPPRPPPGWLACAPASSR